MLALGLQGSPRKKGNSDLLLAMFMEALQRRGATIQTIQVTRQHIEPCKELTVCEKKGFCPIDDDMGRQIYALLRRSDIIVAASPIFFYNVTSQLKALIDRCQTLWARKYMLKLKDPGQGMRRGFLLGVGATRGKQLFDGMHLTAKYFFDAVAAEYAGSLTYRGIEGRGQILKHAGLEAELETAAERLMNGLVGRRKVLVAGHRNACRSQMVAAFARLHAGERLDVISSGSAPAEQADPVMVEAMQEVGIDMAFHTPLAFESVVAGQTPDEVIVIDSSERCPDIPGARRQQWDFPDPAGRPLDAMRRVRDQIEARVKEYIATL